MPYTSINPEMLYTKSFLVIPEHGEPYEDTPEDYLRWICDNKGVCGYAVKTTKAGRWVECELYPRFLSSRNVPKLAPTNQTTPEQQNLNDRNAQRKFCRKLNANFIAGRDWWATLTVDNDHLPMDEATARRHFRNYLERLRCRYVKAGLEFKYAYTIEWKRARDQYHRYLYDAAGNHIMRPHWHLVVSGGLGQDIIRDQWTLGRIRHVEPLEPDETGYTGIAKYATKQPSTGRRRFATSANLITPKPTVAVCHKAATKRKVQKLADTAVLRPDFFEKLYSGKYRFVDCDARYNDVNNGVYLYCRMELADQPTKARGRWGFTELWE